MLMKFIDVVGDKREARLLVKECEIPRPQLGEVLIRVLAAGVNRPDIIQKQGMYPPPPGASDILGLEVAGIVEEITEGCGDLVKGQKVTALLTGGGYAEFCTAAAELCMPWPRDYDAVMAAAVPETFFTVWHNLYQRVAMKAGETLLVHGGSSGIGTTAIQLAKVFGNPVFVTVGSEAKSVICQNLGASAAINYKTQDFVASIMELTNGRGVDVILDMVGGDYLPKNLKCLAPDGRHVSIAFLNGPKAEMNFLPIMLKRLVLTGSTLRSRAVVHKAVIARDLLEKVWPLLDQGTVRPIIHATLPLAEAEEAHRILESGCCAGKIVLTL